MIATTISHYVRALFSLSQYYGYMPYGSGWDRDEYEVEWDEATAEKLAQECGTLVAHLTELAGKKEPQKMTKEQREVWNIYLKPFPEHDFDTEALKSVWEKESIHWELNEEEQLLSRAYNKWYKEICLQRLPWNACEPTDLISRARRYARLVELSAPMAVQEYEAKCLAEEFVLYHCLK